MDRPAPDLLLSPFDDRDRALLQRCAADLLKLASGTLSPKTDGRRMFVRAARGIAPPVTPYEIAFLRWSRAGEPTLDVAVQPKIEPQAPPVSSTAASPAGPASPPEAASAEAIAAKKDGRKRKTKRCTSKTGMSVSAPKKPRPSRYSEAEIERTHRVSKFGRLKARFVAGGKVSPR